MLLGETLAGTNYDRFWVEGQQRKLNTKDKVEAVMAKLNDLKAREDLDLRGKKELFAQTWIEMNLTEAERLEAQRKARDEESKKAVVVEDADWSKEDIAMLTKGISKFPPGTGNRWKVIAEFCGTRNVKEVIKKAQELAAKRQTDLANSRALTERKAEEQKERVAVATAKVLAAEQS